VDLDEVSRAIEASDATWHAGETSLSAYDIDPESVEVLGYVPGPGEPPLDEQEALAEQGLQAYLAIEEPPPYPNAYDWRDVNGDNFITPIRDQARCGSCVAFGTCATVEGTRAVEAQQPDLDIDLSEAHLFYCIARAQGRRCSGRNGGWWVPPALDAFREEGVADEACYPYVGQDQDCTNLCQGWEQRLTTIGSWQELTSHDEMKEWLSSRGPLVGTMTVYEDFIKFYSGGVYTYVSGPLAGGHCICIIGYDDDDDYWIGKNSWGTDWGELGFFRIAYGQCAIDSSMWGVADVSASEQTV
jgi:C1A family cysteine protease